MRVVAVEALNEGRAMSTAQFAAVTKAIVDVLVVP